MSQPKAWPHAGLTPEGEAIPDMADPSCGTEEAPFQAVLVFSDPIDWYRDLQLITDVIMSGQHDMSCCVYASSSLTPSSCQVLLHVWQLIADVIMSGRQDMSFCRSQPQTLIHNFDTCTFSIVVAW